MFESDTTLRALVVAALYLFLPLTALSYYFYRRHVREAELKRILSILKIDSAYESAYAPERLDYYLWSIAYASAISCLGLGLLFLGSELGLPQGEFPSVTLGDVTFPQKGSRIIFGMAFLGAYLWSLQHIYWRYSLNDLGAGVFFGLSVRMIVASMTALIVYNAYTALAGSNGANTGISANIWPALAFLIGMFPRRGLRWLTERLPIFSAETEPAARRAPLAMIEGIEAHDVMRLEELGVDSCYDLANTDFVPLVLKTPYSARQLIDWILQAKLCVHFGDGVKDLRRHGIRTVLDLRELSEEEIQTLPSQTSVTESGLRQARHALARDTEIKRLRTAGELLGIFWTGEGGDHPAAAPGTAAPEDSTLEQRMKETRTNSLRPRTTASGS